MDLMVSEGICHDDLFWVVLRMRNGKQCAETMIRPLPALKIGLCLVVSAIKGILLKK